MSRADTSSHSVSTYPTLLVVLHLLWGLVNASPPCWNVAWLHLVQATTVAVSSRMNLDSLSFYVNHCPLHKETSLMGSEHCTNQQIERHKFRWQFDTMFV